MRLVNPLFVQDLGPISCIVYTRPNSQIRFGPKRRRPEARRSRAAVAEHSGREYRLNRRRLLIRDSRPAAGYVRGLIRTTSTADPS